MRRLLLLTLVLCLSVAAPALAQSPPTFTGFRSVLAFGEGENTSAQDLAAFEAAGTAPPADLNQEQQYADRRSARNGRLAVASPRDRPRRRIAGAATGLALSGWSAAGSQRRALAGSNYVADSPAVLLMDTWWPSLVRAEFQPVLGETLIDFINHNFDLIQPDGIRAGAGNGFFEGWEMDVQKDLRQVLRQPVSGSFSRPSAAAAH